MAGIAAAAELKLEEEASLEKENIPEWSEMGSKTRTTRRSRVRTSNVSHTAVGTSKVSHMTEDAEQVECTTVSELGHEEILADPKNGSCNGVKNGEDIDSCDAHSDLSPLISGQKQVHEEHYMTLEVVVQRDKGCVDSSKLLGSDCTYTCKNGGLAGTKEYRGVAGTKEDRGVANTKEDRDEANTTNKMTKEENIASTENMEVSQMDGSVPLKTEGGGVTISESDITEKLTKPRVTSLSNGVEEDEGKIERTKPPKRMTKVQRATMEALASFGGSSFDSIPVRKIDLRKQLKREADEIRVKEDQDGKEPATKRPRTRLQVAKEEVEEKFRHTALGEGVKKKYPKVVLAKINHKLSPREKTRKYQSKVQRSKADAVEAFGGVASFDKLPIQKKSEMPSTRQYSFSSFKNKPSLKANSVSNDLPSSRHRTRAEIAHLEAIESFGGSNLDDVLGGAKKKVSRTLESSNKKKKQ